MSWVGGWIGGGDDSGIVVPPIPAPIGAAFVDAAQGGIGIFGDFRTSDEQGGELITSLLTFEEDGQSPARDKCRGLDDLSAPAGCDLPMKGVGIIGRAAIFDPSIPTAMQALDRIPGGSLHSRDMTIKAIVSWDIAAQDDYGSPGAIVARGLGTSTVEYMAFALELVVVDAAARTGSVRMLWHDTAGVLKTQTGAEFIVPSATEFFLLTVTRRWVSLDEVVIRYYANDLLLGEVTSGDGDIAGSVDAMLVVGSRYSGAAYDHFFAGMLDELALANYEMAPEEIGSTWTRIGSLQPDGYRQMLDLFQPGLPISDDPTSRVQTDIRAMGVAIGFADGLVENMRQNMMPDRAYGAVLRRWEGITKQPATPGDSLDTRRARVIGHIRKRDGVSPPGVADALKDLLDVEVENVEVIAFDNTQRDDFAALEYERWRARPETDWDVIGGELRVQAAAGSFPWDADMRGGGAKSSLIAVEPPRAVVGASPVNQIAMVASMDPHTLPANSEAGLVLWDWPNHDVLFFGLRNVAGSFKVGYQRYRDGVALDATWQILATTSLAKHWFLIRPPSAAFSGAAEDQDYDLCYSTVGIAEANLTSVTRTWARRLGWAGCYFRTFAATAGAADARFGAFAFRNGLGSRPFYWYAYRNPSHPGAPDLTGAEAVLRRMRHAFTQAHVITQLSVLTDDPACLTDRTPLGAL